MRPCVTNVQFLEILSRISWCGRQEAAKWEKFTAGERKERVRPGSAFSDLRVTPKGLMVFVCPETFRDRQRILFSVISVSLW